MGKDRKRPRISAETKSAPPFSSKVFACILLMATTLAYLPAWNGQPVWDDHAHLTAPELRSLDGLAKIWTKVGATQQYYPLVHSVFWLEHKLWGDAVLPYHLVNILLHALAALLLRRILLKLEIPGAWLAAAIFALHPVHVESVAWISELKNTLSAVCFFSAALVYLRYDTTRLKGQLVLAFAIFVLGLLSKSVIAILPAALLVVLWWKNGSLSLRRDLLPLLPFFIAGISAGLFTAWVERTHIGAMGAEFDLSLVERGLIAGRAFWFYLGKLVWPANLAFVYPRWQISSVVWWQYLFPVSAAALYGTLFFLRQQLRGVLAGLFVFAGLLFPVLGFFNVFPFIYSFVADHFQYLASAGVLALAGAGITLGLKKLRLWGTPGGYAFSGVLLATLAVLTWRQAGSFKDGETLYRTTLGQNPGAWMAHNNLANLLARENRVDEAIGHYRDAVSLRPTYVEAHYNLGNALLQRGKVEEAIAHCRAALAIDPASAEAHNNLGNALRRTGQFEEAIRHYEDAVRLKPHAPFMHNNLAWALATAPGPPLRDGARALEIAQRANKMAEGGDPIVLQTLAAAYAETGDLRQAVETAKTGLALAIRQGNGTVAGVLEKQLTRFQERLYGGSQ